MGSRENSDCKLIDRFSLTERILMRTGWYGFMAVGAYAIYKQAPVWAAAYVLYAVLGFLLVVLPGLCAHCPYPSNRSTCLFLPPVVMNRFYPYKGPEMTGLGKISVFVVMVFMVLIPNYWLVSDLPMLLLYWLLAGPTVAAVPFHYCKRCRHFGCSLNRTGKKLEMDYLR